MKWTYDNFTVIVVAVIGFYFGGTTAGRGSDKKELADYVGTGNKLDHESGGHSRGSSRGSVELLGTSETPLEEPSPLEPPEWRTGARMK